MIDAHWRALQDDPLLVLHATIYAWSAELFEPGWVLDVGCEFGHGSAILSEVKRVLKNGGMFYSRTFTDQVYLGQANEKFGILEYNNVSDGPFAGRGFVRLVNKKGIHKLYGKFFNIISVDKLEYTNKNGKFKISEWIIVCENEK